MLLLAPFVGMSVSDSASSTEAVMNDSPTERRANTLRLLLASKAEHWEKARTVYMILESRAQQMDSVLPRTSGVFRQFGAGVPDCELRVPGHGNRSAAYSRVAAHRPPKAGGRHAAECSSQGGAALGERHRYSAMRRFTDDDDDAMAVWPSCVCGGRLSQRHRASCGEAASHIWLSQRHRASCGERRRASCGEASRIWLSQRHRASCGEAVNLRIAVEFKQRNC